jgi:Chlorophyll A-B binding protein
MESLRERCLGWSGITLMKLTFESYSLFWFIHSQSNMKVLVVSSLLAAASAFVPAQVGPSSKTALSETKADLEALAAKLNPVVKFYDPLNLASADFYGMGSEATIGFLRQSEIKHGRIAMFAFVGYIVQSNFVFPWAQTLAGSPHPSADLSPEAQWDAIPLGAKWQIFAVISALELWDECGGGKLPHYTKVSARRKENR